MENCYSYLIPNFWLAASSYSSLSRNSTCYHVDPLHSCVNIYTVRLSRCRSNHQSILHISEKVILPKSKFCEEGAREVGSKRYNSNTLSPKQIKPCRVEDAFAKLLPMYADVPCKHSTATSFLSSLTSKEKRSISVQSDSVSA